MIFFLLLVMVEGVMRWGHPHAKISPADPFPSRITLRKVFYSGRKNVWFWSKIWRRIQRSALALYIFPILCSMVGVSSSHASEFIGVLGNCGCRVRSPRGRRLHEGRGSRVLGISNALTPASYPLISHGNTRREWGDNSHISSSWNIPTQQIHIVNGSLRLWVYVGTSFVFPSAAVNKFS